MIEYEVEIEERPLGVRFAHADRGETVVVHLVLENKAGHKLGLLPGDILLAVNGVSVLDKSSAEALELFRGQELPFKASFRRFEDDDDFDSDEEENSETDLQSAFMQEEVSSMMHKLGQQPSTHGRSDSVAVAKWSCEEVVEWLKNYGTANYDDEKRFGKYSKVFKENNIDGKALKSVSKEQLQKLGVAADDVQDLYRGIVQLKTIIFNAPNQSQLAAQMKDASGAGGDDEKAQNNNDEEPDNWEAPFLPYMYDAPQVELSDKTVVKVYSARVVSPYKKKAFALYEIEVVEGKDEWLLSKRYTEFYKLYEQMKKLGAKTKISFPKKGVFYKSTDKQVMEDRKKNLTQYLTELLKHHPKGRQSKELKDFLSPSRTFVVDE
mmetsp:Transcript_42763/g.70581  ORF Transcript_42763/g.70581 Transcript_42763/m.70581 type:complete len:379 (-) Transcript_42763:147-1283(-)|eukprot:CAMPEP_0202702758 /NCGR_PEP_ID=MMETSP1385-20130828/15693_1 /ASSEMBLY_ACC=CAM_ASM_000861 /TAXON_ID=933848 /ORGANISM="Elphidium margaritaceum" /LENGTH=378 /DNA_ID=CAMNT_0049360469 /DNA_START=46 /DNA_END=1182 /DNA_ORIENTATION=+